MINKKGAIEMSMTTIIVMVLGVTLLILGLVFVKFVFTKGGNLAKTAFEKAEGSIDELSQKDKPLVISPDKIEIKKGESQIISILLVNLGEDKTTAKAKVSTKSEDNDLTCSFEETLSSDSDSHIIPSGEYRNTKLRVESKNTGNLGNKVCKIVVTGLGEGIQDTLSIKVTA